MYLRDRILNRILFTAYFLRWSGSLAWRGHWREAGAAFLEAFDRGRAHRQASEALRRSLGKSE